MSNFISSNTYILIEHNVKLPRVSAPGARPQTAKESMMTESISGIYEIRNIVNDHRYIGSAVDLYHRHATHISKLKKNQHANPHLQSAYNKYGESYFEYSVLEYCSKDNLLDREQFWIDSLKPEYNIRVKAESNLGLKLSAETKAKQSAALRGRAVSEETRAKLSAHFKGRPIPPEQREKISATLTGRPGHPVSAETRQKLSNAFKGRPLSAETRAKLSSVHTGKKLSPEHKATISLALKGKTIGKIISEETRKKLSVIGKGKTGSDSNAARPICQYSRLGLFMTRYSCAAEAERVTGINRSNIGECCKGKRKTAGGYIWRYADDKGT